MSPIGRQRQTVASALHEPRRAPYGFPPCATHKTHLLDDAVLASDQLADEGFCMSVSARALIIRLLRLGSGDHDGTSPHFISLAS
jgi:hypothetical protein